MTMVNELGQEEQTQSFYQDLSKLKGLLPNKEDTPLYKHWWFRLTVANQSVTVFTDAGCPDYWLVYTLPTWSATPGNPEPTVTIFYQAGSNSIGGEPEIALAGGGSARLPGISEYMTVRASLIGTNGCNFGIVAVRKYEFDVYVNPGGG